MFSPYDQDRARDSQREKYHQCSWWRPAQDLGRAAEVACAKDRVAAGQLPLRESFRDFDGLEKGVCTKDQAHAVLLSVLRINLSESDWEGLLQQFVRADGMFAYDALCSQIEASLGNPARLHLTAVWDSKLRFFESFDMKMVKMPEMPHNYEKRVVEAQQYPTRVVPVQTPSELRSAQEDKTPMTQEELVRLRELQERLAFKVKQTRKVLLPTFQDFDKRCTQHVTRRQLWRILGMLDLPVNEEELNLLCLWLCDKGNLQEVAYRPLLHAIDPPIKGSSQQGNLEEISESVYYRDGKVVPMAETLSRIKQH
ncbi:hypothetical protein, conserved [Eimeria necatrix]|uniref:Uncharacterized protein n=1 Tax=Eimeria necatrix TaxID=51315 RepID=U6MVZ4_9EIME|nr:hypothetical protein, conserved [Eimeria necatrix]CDJ66654.1 hypothetical protein, conserved [Eimeria necatrix]